MLHGRGCPGDIAHLSDVLDSAEGSHHILAVLKVKLGLDHSSVLHQGKAALEGGPGEEVGRVAMPKAVEWLPLEVVEESTPLSSFNAGEDARHREISEQVGLGEV